MALSDPGFRDALLAEIKKTKFVFYSTVVAQAQRIVVMPDAVTFVYGPAQKSMVGMFEQSRSAVEAIVQQISGKRVPARAEVSDGAGTAAAPPPPPDPVVEKKSALREQALEAPAVQALLEVFPAEIRDVEEVES